MVKKIIIGVLLILVLAGVGFVIWGSTAMAPSTEALQAAVSGNGVIVEDNNGWLAFRPESRNPVTGLIFYPGARVDGRAYAPLLRQVASQGYLVVVVPMPLNFAIFGIEKASDVIRAYPQVKNWAIGGHSLGGSMAAQFVINHPDAVRGLVFWASYPPGSMVQLSNLPVVSIFGTKDGLATLDKIEASKQNLPASTLYLPVVGGDHAQFGSYGAQPGDNPADISATEQWTQIVAATVNLLKLIDK